MKLTQLWETKDKPTVSFEFFPARNEKAAVKLVKVIDKLANIKPDFVSVTFGAGGSTREGSYALAKTLKEDKGLEVLPYFAFTGLGPSDIASVIDGYQGLGLDNILTIRGDLPEDKEVAPHPEAPKHTSDLLAAIRPNSALCIGAAGHPEGHPESQNLENDIEFLKLKVDNGADFIITNYFWDNRYFFEFMDRCQKANINVPILPGLMPIFNVKIMRNLAALCGATVTDEIENALAALAPDDKKGVSRFGTDLAIRQCEELIKSGAPGIHIYTMDKSKAAIKIVNHLRESDLI